MVSLETSSKPTEGFSNVSKFTSDFILREVFNAEATEPFFYFFMFFIDIFIFEHSEIFLGV